MFFYNVLHLNNELNVFFFFSNSEFSVNQVTSISIDEMIVEKTEKYTFLLVIFYLLSCSMTYLLNRSHINGYLGGNN